MKNLRIDGKLLSSIGLPENNTRQHIVDDEEHVMAV